MTFLDPSYVAKLQGSGAVHHGRFLSKAIYYLKHHILLEEVLKISADTDKEIKQMGTSTAVFYVPQFLTSEKPDIAAHQVIKTFTLNSILI